MDEEVLNQSLLPLFGIEDDAFLAYDNPVKADEAQETSKRLSYVQGGILTANEAREMEGLEKSADPNADRLLIGGQPLGGAPAPAASPFAGLFGASAAQPRQDAALTFGTATDTETKAIELQVSNATCNTKDALGDCVSAKIPKLLDEGYEQDQAVAIAYSMCTEGKSLDQVNADRRAEKKSCGCGCASRKTVKQSEFVGKHSTDFGAWLKVKSAEKEAEKIGKAEAEAAAKVSRVFDAQTEAVLAALRKAERPTQDLISQADRLLRSRSYQRELVDALAPYLREAIATGVNIGIDTVSKVATSVDFAVERADLERYAETESIRLARRTASGVTETQAVRFKEVLGNGVAEGETVDELATRVQDWAASQKDEDGSWSRARTVARTEAMRAARTAEVEAWTSTGMVTGKTWLLAPDPCEFCEAASKSFGEKAIGLGDAFYTKGEVLTGADGNEMVLDYENVDGPPLHPNCRCSMQPQFDAEIEQILAETEAEGEAAAQAEVRRIMREEENR